MPEKAYYHGTCEEEVVVPGIYVAVKTVPPLADRPA
jgi:hypothetical protein